MKKLVLAVVAFLIFYSGLVRAELRPSRARLLLHAQHELNETLSCCIKNSGM